ncbi:hypothetical protein ACSQ67_024068 [Phaseolus vulgaris]
MRKNPRFFSTFVGLIRRFQGRRETRVLGSVGILRRARRDRGSPEPEGERTEQLSFAQVVSGVVARSGTSGNASGVVGRVKDFRINGVLFKVSFEEEGCIPDLAFKNLFGEVGWRRFEVDTEASSEEGSLGASICDSVDSELAVAGSGRVGVVGGGRVENEELVQGRVESIPLGMDETNSQEQLNGAGECERFLRIFKGGECENNF